MAEYVEMILCSVCSIILFLWFYFHNKNSVLTNWPILGMLPSLLRNAARIHDFISDVMIQSGGTFHLRGIWFANMDLLLTCDPRNIHYILTENFGNFHKGRYFRETFFNWGNGIFNADKDLWKMQRKMIQSTLRKENVMRFLRSCFKVKVADGIIRRLNLASEECQEIDLQQVFKQFTFDTVCLMILGIDPGSLTGKSHTSKYQKAFDKLEEAAMFRILRPTPYWKLCRWLGIGIEKESSDAAKTMDPFVNECISLQVEQLKQARGLGKEAGSTILTTFLDQHVEDVKDGNGDIIVSRKLMRDVAVNLLFAGRDTISDSLCWFFFLVGTHPLVENKLVREIEENSESSDVIEQESELFPEGKLGGLVYMHAALCETLRLYPPVSFNMKFAVVPDRLPSGHAIKSNARVVIPLYAIGRMENVWGTDCREFKPERWISEQGQIIQVPSNKFAAFNSGPRSCVGKELSFFQLKMVAASLIWKYHIEIVEGHPVLPHPFISLQMQHGLKVRVRKRRTAR